MAEKEKITDVLSHVCNEIIANEPLLTDLDRAIGDGDHGLNMKRGCEAIKNALPELASLTLPEVLNKCGTILLGKVGGASGPLYGTAFMKAAAVLKTYPEKEQDQPTAVVKAITEALAGIKHLGKAEPGDKTMVDVIEPFAKELQEQTSKGKSLKDSWMLALSKATEGLEATKPMIAKKGRASYLGERSAGTHDPGATSSLLILQAAGAGL